MTSKTGFLSKIFERKCQVQGYTLPEILVAMTMASVLAAVAIASNPFGQTSKLNDAAYQLEGILRQTRSRAIATTSAIRIEPDPDNPNNVLKIESSETRGCEAISALSDDVIASDDEIPILSVGGFNIGDRLKIGSDETDNVVIAIDSNQSLLRLGQELGSSQSEGAVVQLLNNWKPDGALLTEDLTFDEPMEITSNIANDKWRLCFNSRGFARLYDAEGVVNQDLQLTISNTDNNDSQKITVVRGGAAIREVNTD